MSGFPFLPSTSECVLVASASHVVRDKILRNLRSRPYRVEQAHGGAEALQQLESGPWQRLFLDRHLPDLDPDELAETVRRRFPETEVVLVEGDTEELANIEPATASLLELAAEQPETLSQAVSTSPQAALPGMIGSSRAMQPIYRVARLLARRETAVLICGPTGSGKELVARAIHQLSPRVSRNFVVINCAAIPEALLESELFGHTRGAFTGAMQSYGGRIQSAHGGTLFLDEIGEMPLSLQPKLLRFLEQKELQRLGSCELVRVDTRIIAATNAHLPALVRQGKFREDLYYRLSAFPLEIPPLRERTEDVCDLARHFLRQFAGRANPLQFSQEAIQLLKAQPWPGNVRELQNVIERAVILAENQPIVRAEHLRLIDNGVRR